MKNISKLSAITLVTIFASLALGCGGGGSDDKKSGDSTNNNSGGASNGGENSPSSDNAGNSGTPGTGGGSGGGTTSKTIFDKYRIVKSKSVFITTNKATEYAYTYDDKNRLKKLIISVFDANGNELADERFIQTHEYDGNDNLIRRTSVGSTSDTTGDYTFTYSGDNMATQSKSGEVTTFSNYVSGYATLQETKNYGDLVSTATREIKNKKLSKYHYINSNGTYEDNEVYTYDEAKGVITNKYTFTLRRTKSGIKTMTFDIKSNLKMPRCFKGNFKQRFKPFDDSNEMGISDFKTPASYACALPTKYYNKYDHWDNGLTETYKYTSDARNLVTKLETYDNSNELEYVTTYEYESY